MYSKILNKLNACGVGYKNANNIGMNLISGYHYINEERYAELQKMAKQLFSTLTKINLLYKKAIIQNDNSLLYLFETGFLKAAYAKNLHRKLFLDGKQTFPLIFRGDSPNLRQFLEFHVGFRGLGYLHAFRDVISECWGEAGLFNHSRLASFDDAIASVLGKNCSKIIFLKRPKEDKEIKYFFQKIFPTVSINMKNRGFSLFLKPETGYSQHKNIYVSPRDYYLMQILSKRYFFLNLFTQKLSFKKLSSAVESCDTKADMIEPAPNLLYEQKMPMAIIYDEKYREYFTEDDRSIFPETYIIKKNSAMHFEEGGFSLQDIVEMPMKRRNFIVKYAGLGLQSNWGSRAVYRLKKISKPRVSKILKDALISYEKFREPWIIQKDISCKENISYFDIRSGSVITDENYKLYRPYFICLPQGNTIDVLDIFVLFRDHYKVHANRDCAIGLVSVKNTDER